MKYMEKQKWFEEVTNHAAVNEVATRTGLSPATLWRQYNNDLGFTAENLIIVARTYGASPIEALVIFGFLNEEERAGDATLVSLSKASDDDLIQELARRMKDNTSNPKWNEPMVYEPTDEDRQRAKHVSDLGLAAKHGDTDGEQEAYEVEP
jgi:hypothetical protein